MMTEWKSNKPGGYDALNVMKGIFPSDNDWGIPNLLRNEFIPKDLISYKDTLKATGEKLEMTTHFFLEDYHFESVWNNPIKTLSRIQKIGHALTPDYSLYSDYPEALQIYNTYRNRWLGRYWQENGVLVIPTVSWGDEYTYRFCFEGIPWQSTVAISTVGTRDKESKQLFIEGFEAMMYHLEPTKLIVYGETKPLEFENYVDDVYYYKSYWGKVRNKLEGE